MEYDFLSTFSGKRLYFQDPEPDQIVLQDIAHGLSMTPRFAGQCRTFYSVAMHAVNVASVLEDQGKSMDIQFYGLLHDASEAYLPDIPSPVKNKIEGYKEFEENVLQAVWASFGVPSPSEDEWTAVREVDRRIVHHEASELLTETGWETGDRVDGGIRMESREKSRELFIERAEALLSRL